MSARRKRASQRRSAAARTAGTVKSDSTSAPPAPLATAPSAEGILDECVGAICLVEVTLHSLESQEIASPEQEVLKRALKAIWSVHDWIYELKPHDTDSEGADGEGES